MKKEGEDDAITFSVTDLSKINNVATALASFASWQKGLLESKGITAWTDLAYSRSRSLDFFNANLTSSFMDMVDIIDMIDREWFQSPETTALIESVKSAVIYKVAGNLRGDARGLSLMFPSGNVWQTYLDLYKTLPFVPEYQDLVEKFADYARNKVPDKSISDPSLAGSTMTSHVTPADANFEQAYACIVGASEGSTVIYGHKPIWSSTPGMLEYTWDGSWYTLNGAVVSVLAEPRDDSETTVTLRIPMVVENDTGVYYLRYDYTSDTIKLLGFLKNCSDELTNVSYKGLVQLKPGDLVTPMVYVLDKTSWLDNKWVKGTAAFIVPSSGLVFTKTSLPSGTYNIEFMVEDLRLKPSVSSSVTFEK